LSYGSIYESIFESRSGEIYIIDIQKLGYSGSVTDIVCATARPCVHRHQQDDPKAPVSGATVEFSFLNENGALPLSTFYSVIDNEYRVVLSWRGQPLFIGFFVQDDCEEELIDGTHEIKITATDNLGLLKDVPLNNAADLFGTRTDYTAVMDAGGTTINITATIPVNNGDLIQIEDGTVIDGTYKVLSFYYLGPVTTLTLETPVPYLLTSTSVDFTVIRPVDLTERISLAKIIRLCLLSTGLELITFAYTNIVPSNAQTDRFLEQTLISGETFLSGTKYDDCYTVLEKIMRRFNACLFQSFGVWNIQRWNELRYYSNATMQWKFSIDMDYVSANYFDGTFTYGNGDDIQTGITASILRPYKFVKDTFNYKQPENLLKNYNLQILGERITSYTVGAETYTEYKMPFWNDGPFAPIPDRYIRVITDALGNEITRYAVLTGATGDSPRSAESSPIEIVEGDTFRLSFSFRTDVSQAGAVNAVFSVRLFNGAITKYLGDAGEWKNVSGYTYTVVSGDNTNTWHTVEITAKAAPISGLLYIYLGEETASSSDQTWYKDIQFEYKPTVNDSTIIIGHTHTDSQIPKISNRYDEEIHLDDSPRNSIQGTLFLVSFLDNIRARTTIWDKRLGSGEELRLGQLITMERLFWRRRPRTKLNGTFEGLVKNGKHIQKNICLRYNSEPGKNFVLGTMAIDYKNDEFSCTAYEEYEDGEADSSLVDYYKFQYLYQNK